MTTPNPEQRVQRVSLFDIALGAALGSAATALFFSIIVREAILEWVARVAEELASK